jgi:3-hydroxyisobutyrate dehydrogenase-like beta-hydroxyacid dehydrogenase
VSERAAQVAGARAAASPREVAAASDVVGLCVRDDADVRAAMRGDAGVLAGAAHGAIIAIHSTVQPAPVIEVAALAAERGVGVVDACITGGGTGAAQGTLTVMVGGDAAHVDRARPFFDCFAKKVVHTGPLGTGCKLKLCNNLRTYLAWTAAYEAMLLARAAGSAAADARRVTGSTATSPIRWRAFLARKAPAATRSSERSFQAMMRGFVEIAEKISPRRSRWRECGIALPGTAMASQIMARVYGLDDAAPLGGGTMSEPKDGSTAGLRPEFQLEDLSKEALALYREFMIAAHLLDRAIMPAILQRFGAQAMEELAIEEWRGASPVYTERIRKAMKIEGNDVAAIFKSLQMDPGFPHQYMDVHYEVVDAKKGYFWLDYCGALADVEPWGEARVVSMCHIKNPTDATMQAVNPKAKCRPVQRPPQIRDRRSAGKSRSTTLPNPRRSADHEIRGFHG